MFSTARIPHCLTCLGVKGQCKLIVTLWNRSLWPPDKGHCDIVTSQSRQLWPPQTGHCDQLNQPLRGPHLRLMQMGICWEEIKALKSRDGCNDFLKSLQIVGSGTPRFNHKNKSWMILVVSHMYIRRIISHYLHTPLKEVLILPASSTVRPGWIDFLCQTRLIHWTFAENWIIEKATNSSVDWVTKALNLSCWRLWYWW